jgi:RecJ-like exonuclease
MMRIHLAVIYFKTGDVVQFAGRSREAVERKVAQTCILNWDVSIECEYCGGMGEVEGVGEREVECNACGGSGDISVEHAGMPDKEIIEAFFNKEGTSEWLQYSFDEI